MFVGCQPDGYLAVHCWFICENSYLLDLGRAFSESLNWALFTKSFEDDRLYCNNKQISKPCESLHEFLEFQLKMLLFLYVRDQIADDTTS